MTKKTIEIAVLTVGIIFLCWYLPVAFYNVYACDDYWFGTNVRLNGFWGNQLSHWYKWEGSYTHTFLASLPHVINYSHMPFFGNLFSLLLLYTSLFYFLRTYSKLAVRKCLIYSLYFLSLLYLSTKGNSEIRFWICANVTYVSEMSFLLFLFSLYHKCDKDCSCKRKILLLLIIFLVAGSKLTFILYAISGLVIHDVLYNIKFSRKNAVVFFVLAIFVLINVTAPGNYIRLEVETMPKEISEQMNLFETIVYRILEMRPFLLCTLLLLPIAIQWRSDHLFNIKRVYIALFIVIFTFVSDSVIMYACFNDPGPLRVYFSAEVFISLLTLLFMNNLYSYVFAKYDNLVNIALICVIIVVISNIPMLLQVPSSIEFSHKSRERDRYVAASSIENTIQILKLPESYLMLSYFANDTIWLENIYLPYFQKKGKVIVVDKME